MLTTHQRAIVKFASLRVAETRVSEFNDYIVGATFGWTPSNKELHAIVNEALALARDAANHRLRAIKEQQLDVV